MLTLVLNPQRPVHRLAGLACAACGDRPCVLIVPEQLSHEAERMLCSLGGAEICLHAEVLSFTRLAQRLRSLYGGAARGRLDGAGRILAMSLAAEELRGRIKYFAAAMTRPEFLEELLHTVDELKACCIEPAQLLESAKRRTGAVAQKLEELGLLMEAYGSVCANTAYDPRDELSELADQLLEERYAEQRCFCVGGFQDFTGQELRVLESLLRRGAELTLLLCCDSLEDGGSCFAAARRTGRKLRTLAARYGVQTRVVQEQPAFFPEQAFLLRHLYDGSKEIWPEASERVQLFQASDIQEECREAVEQVWRAVLNGARFREIGFALCDMDAACPTLTQQLSARSLPYYCAGRTDVCSRPLFALVLRALECVACGYRREQVIAYLRTGLALLPEDEIDRLENYAIAWNIRGGRWFRPFTEHPDGYDAQMDDDARAQLAALNAARARAAEPLQQLEQGLRRAKNTQQQVLALFEFLRTLQLSQRLETLAGRLRAEGREQLAQEQAQLYSVLVQAMEQLYALGGTVVRTPEGFYRMVQLLLGQYEVATIPATLDAVTIGSLEDLRCRPFRYLFVLGAADGLFPPFARARSLISEEERELLRSDGLALPSVDEQLDRGSMTVYGVLAGAQERLYVSCAEQSGQPSYLFGRLCRQFPACVREKTRVFLSDFWSPEACGAMAAAPGAPEPALPQPLQSAALRAREQLRTRAAYDAGNLSPEAVRALYGSVLRLSPSRIDRLSSCRCGYYLEYGLRLRERREYRFDAPVFGTFVHFVLEQTVRAVEQEGGFSAVSDGRIRALAEENIERFAAEQLSALAGKDERFVYLFRRNQGEVLSILESLAREMRRSDFHAKAFELRFAPDGELPAIPVEGARQPAEIVGVVDRADCARVNGREYLRIVDYKTGRKALDYTDLSIGIGLQMPIYLFALQRLGLPGQRQPLSAAGVLYFPAREPILSAPRRLSDEEAEQLRRRENRRSGLVTDDTELLEAMEHTQGSPEFLPYQNGRDGRRGDLATPRHWELLERHVSNTLRALVDTVAEGAVAPNPYTRGPRQGSCSWCKYAPVCRFEASGGCMRSYEKMPAADFWAQLEKEVEQDG